MLCWKAHLKLYHSTLLNSVRGMPWAILIVINTIYSLPVFKKNLRMLTIII